MILQQYMGSPMNINEDIPMMKAKRGAERAVDGEITCECGLLIILDATAADITNTPGHESAKLVKSY